MKNLLIIISCLILLGSGCSKPGSKTNDCGKWVLVYSNGSTLGNKTITCDSLQMVSTGEAYIYIKGSKTHIFAERLYPVHILCQ